MTTGGDDSEKPRPRRDAWDKAEIVLQPIGGLLTALAVAVLGFWTSSYLREREGREAALRERMQTSDTNARLYSELTSKREESESALRKDMFTSIISSFLRSGPATPEQKMLNLELLVYNFHESLNLKPLFLHIEREVKTSPNRADYVKRLNQVADAVIKKQMLVIEDGGETFDATIDTRNLIFPNGETSAPFVAKELVVDGIRRNVKLEVLTADPETAELQLRMTIRTVESNRVDTSSTEFWIGHFDFPMIDNTRLPHDQRLAVVLNNYDPKRGAADITAALFPGKYAGLREKPYYDEVLAKLLAANRTAAVTPPAK
ncbi:MAG: hypothetical protein M3S32_03910 [Acidobacteriota bacterium]|nr:hypothetical protein [Acidobacteriota bacterium]